MELNSRPADGPFVLIDATAVPANRGGVGRYVDGLLHAMEGRFAIACQQHDADFYRALAPSATILPQSGRIASAPARLVWEQVFLPRLARRIGAQVVHSPHYTVPLLLRVPRVVTFHDATFFSDPGLHTRVKRIFFSLWTRVSARLADVAIVPSQATADELARFVRRKRGYVVAHHGVDFDTFHEPSADEISEASGRLGLGSAPWIAFIGTIEPRKNLPALVRGYRAMAESWDPRNGSVPALALAGGAGWETTLDAEIAKVASPAVVHQLGFIDLELVRGYLGGALLVTYPSLGEGFGLPVLEAMACGVPVLTTRQLALPEVGGDAVAYSETDAASIGAALLSLAGDGRERSRLAQAGVERSSLFTWQASARVHLEAFRSAVGSKRK
jgi:glycosyltransferase involved in cell wall biosynthesis